MSVHGRKGKRGVVWWVCTSYGAKRQHWERIGTSKREAERLDKLRRKEVEDGEFDPDRATPRTSVRAWATKWAADRANKTADEDQRSIRYVLEHEWFAAKKLSDLTVRDAQRLISELRARFAGRDKTMLNVWGSCRTMLRDAYLAELTTRNVGQVPRGTLPPMPRSPRGSYSVREVETILERARVGNDRLVLWAIEFFTGCRQGEAAGLRWGDWDRAMRPLTGMHVVRQWDGEPLKTGHPRLVPVASELQLLLEWWHGEGFELFACRRPSDEDRIVPAIDPRRVRAGGGHSHTSIEYAWHQTLDLCGIPRRTNHETRHTMITEARRAGADVEVLKLITHNPTGAVIDGYTHHQWETLCRVVEVLPFRIVAIDLVIDRDRGPRVNTGAGSDSCTGQILGRHAAKRGVSCAMTCDRRPREVPITSVFPARSLVIDAGQSAQDLAIAYREATSRRAA